MNEKMTWRDLEAWIVQQGFAKDEYFQRAALAETPPDTPVRDGQAHWVAVFWVVGGSEGHYVHVERIMGDQPELVLVGKFWSWERAEQVANKIQYHINMS